MRERLMRELAADYEEQRERNRREEQQRYEAAGLANPEIIRLTEERRRLFFRQMSAAFADPDSAMDISRGLTQNLEKIARELRQCLVSAGFPEDYLQPVFRCPLCQDTGYVGGPVRDTCVCLKRRLFERMSHEAGHGLRLEENFANYRKEIYPGEPLGSGQLSQRSYMNQVMKLCERYSDAFPDTEKLNLLFHGRSGLGKTYLMHCIGERVLSRGHSVRMLSAYQLLGILREAYFGRGDEPLRLLMEQPLLLIDDLGTEPMLENLTIVQLFNLLNERLLRGRHTVISSNLSKVELKERYTERVCSRLFDARHTIQIRFVGQDVRLQNEKKED